MPSVRRSQLLAARQVRPVSLRSLTSLLLAAACTFGAGLPALAAPLPQVSVSCGALRSLGEHEVAIWANSPQTALTLRNPSGGFLSTATRWVNVPVGSYLVTPSGVAEAATRDGISMQARVTLSGGSTGRWRLDPNLKGAYTFAVSGGDLPALGMAQRVGGINFAMHLGNARAALGETIATLEHLPFPTYVVPGNRDRYADYVARTGPVRRDFAIGRDRFVVLDNADARVRQAQREWLAGRLRAFRSEGARRVFVFMHWPLIDPRRGKHVQMESSKEIRALQRVFQEGGVSAVFASHIPIANRSTRNGVDYHIVGPGHALVVRVQDDSLSVQTLP
ncbi:MAG TPA: hypothetical protein V6D05_11945 [Stenomitos sp.]